MKMKNWLALLMTVALLAGMLAACGQGPGAGGASTPAEGGSSAPAAGGADSDAGDALEELPPTTWDENLTFPKHNDEIVEFEIYINDPASKLESWGLNAYSRWVERETGTKITFTQAISDNQEELNLRISTGDLPDMIFFPNSSVSSLGTLINEGMLYDLDTLADQHCPTFKDLSMYKGADYYRWEQGGTLYYLPTNAYDRGIMEDPAWQNTLITGGAAYYARQDIVDELGASLTTLEEVLDAAYAAKEAHPELTSPILLWDVYHVFNTDNGLNMMYRSMGGGHKYIESGGTITSMARDPLYFDTLMMINQLVKDGIVNPADFDGAEAHRAQDTENKNANIFLSAGPGWRIIDGDREIKNVDPSYNYWGIDFFATEGKEFFNPHYDLDGGGAFVITTACENPDRAIMFYEFLATEQTQLNVNKGLQGVHWEMTGPDNTWMVPIGEALDLMTNVGYPEWQDYTGGNLYRWVGSIVGDSAGARGDAIDDPVRARIWDLEGATDDFTSFTKIDPPAGSDEALALEKIIDQWRSYMVRVVLDAKDEAEGRAIWDEFLEKADSLGLADVEAYWTLKYGELHQLKIELGDA